MTDTPLTEAISIARYTGCAYGRLIAGIRDVIDALGEPERATLLAAVEESAMMIDVGLA